MAAGACLAEVAIPSLPPAAYLLGRLDGRAESMIEPDAPAMPTRLLEALLRDRDGGAVDIQNLPVAFHDRLLAFVYRAELGDSVKARAACPDCGESFEFGFSLADLLATQDEAAAAVGLPDGEGRWTAPGRLRLRPPTLADAGAGSGAALLERLAGTPVPPELVEDMAAFLEAASPLLSVDISTRCPGCEADRQVRFDLPRFLVDALAGERPFLIRETHLVAARYGWSHAEILALSREDRRAFAALIESERSAALRRAS